MNSFDFPFPLLMGRFCAINYEIEFLQDFNYFVICEKKFGQLLGGQKPKMFRAEFFEEILIFIL